MEAEVPGSPEAKIANKNGPTLGDNVETGTLARWEARRLQVPIANVGL